MERVELAAELQVGQTPGQLEWIGGRLLASPKVQLAQSPRDVGETAVAVIDVLHGRVGTPVGVLGQLHHRVGVGDEVAAVAEHRVNAVLPRPQIQRAAPIRERARRQPLAQPPIGLDLLHHKVHQRVVVESGHVGAHVRLFGSALRSVRSTLGPRFRERDGDTVLAQPAVLADRARARPRHLRVAAQLNPVRHRPAHYRGDRVAAAVVDLNPSLPQVDEATRERTRVGQQLDLRLRSTSRHPTILPSRPATAAVSFRKRRAFADPPRLLLGRRLVPTRDAFDGFAKVPGRQLSRLGLLVQIGEHRGTLCATQRSCEKEPIGSAHRPNTPPGAS